MKSRLCIPLFAALLLLTGCGSDDNKIDNLWHGEIRFASDVTTSTADTNTPSDTQIADKQEVGLFINEKATPNTVIGANLKYVADGNGGLTLADPTQNTPYYPNTANTDNAVTIIAYQPYNKDAKIDANNTYNFEVQTDQSDADNYYKSDLLYSASKEYARQSAAHNLVFAHKLSKIVCTLTPGTGAPDLTGATVEILNTKINGTFNILDGSFDTSVGTTSEVKMNSTITPGSYIAIIPPQTYSNGTQFLQVTLSTTAGVGKYFYIIPEELTIGEGKVYTFEITVNRTELTVTTSIGGWNTGDTSSGSAVL